MRIPEYPLEYNDWVNRRVRQFDFRMEFNGIQLTTSEVSSIKIHSDLLTGDTFEIGSSVAETLEFDVFMDDTYINKSLPIRPYISLYTEVEIDKKIVPVWQEICLGTFYIDPDGVTKKGLKTISVKASSILYHPEYGGKVYVPSFEPDYDWEDEIPRYNTSFLIDDICEQLGINSTGSGEDYVRKDSISGMTYREAINYINLLFGHYARINPPLHSYTGSDELHFFEMEKLYEWYETGYVLDTDKYMSLSIADEVLTVKSFICNIDEGKTITVGSGSPSETIKITCPDMQNFLLESLLEKYEGFSYSPMKCKIFGNPAIQVGDIIKVIDVKGNTHLLPVQRITYNITGSGITMDIESLYKVENISSGSSVRKAISELNKDVVQTKLLIADEVEAINATIEDLTVNRIAAVEIIVKELTVTGEANIKELDNAKKDIENLKTNKADKTELGKTNTALDELTKRVTTNEGNISNNTKEITNIKKDYATKTELTNKADKTELHSHSNKTVIDSITNDNITSWNNKSEFSGSYNDLTDKPNIPSVEGLASEQYVQDQISALNIASLLERIAALEARIQALEDEN